MPTSASSFLDETKPSASSFLFDEAKPSLWETTKTAAELATRMSPLSLMTRPLLPLGEAMVKMGTGFAGALPGVAAGLYGAATGEGYTEPFKHVQDFYTYEPRDKAISDAIDKIFEKYSQGVDVVAEATPGGPLAQTAVKTLGEAIPLVAPFTPRIIKGMRRPTVETELKTPETDAVVSESKPSASDFIEETKPIEYAVAGDAGVVKQAKSATKFLREAPEPKEIPGILSEIKKMGGINSAEGAMRDITGESRTGKGVRGIPPGLFHKNGRGLDELATRLRENGYLIPEDAADGGVQALKDMIRDEVQGTQKHYSAFDEEAVYREMADRARGRFEEQDFNAQEVKILPEREQHVAIAVADELATKAPDNWGKLTEEQKNAHLDEIFGTDTTTAAAGKASGESALQGASGSAATEANKASAFSLTAETEAQIHAREAAQRLADEAVRRKEEAPPASDFVLSGSDRATDQATARGQMELGGGTLSVNPMLDPAAISNSIKFAEKNLKDALGIPEKGVEVVPSPIAKEPGFLTSFRSPSELVKKFPEIKPIKDNADHATIMQDTLRDAFRRRLGHIENLFGGGLQKVKDFGKAYRENKRAFNELLVEGDMIGKRFTAEELADKGISPNVIKAYDQIRSAYDHALGLANQARDLRGKLPVNKREGYVPHFFHNYFVIGDGAILSSAKTLREAVSMGNDAARTGVKVKIIPKQFEFPGEATQAAVIGDHAYFKLKNNLEKSFELTTEEAQSLIDGIIRMRGRSRFVGNFLERKGAPGWEQNLDWAHRHYFNMISRYVALDEFKSKSISYFERKFGAFDKEHTGIAQYAKSFINDVNGVPTKAEALLNSSISNMPLLNKFVQRHLGDRPSLQIASAVTNAVAIAKLGLYNVSAALVNGTQLIMANALLTEKWTGIGAMHAARVSAELVKRKVGFEGATNPDIGILRQLDVNIQQGLESGAGYSKFNQMGRIFRTSTALFQKVEFELRATTGLGAYYKALSEGKTKADALDYAREINRRVNFDYSIADAPDFIRRSGPLGQVLFQFKKFPLKAMEFMGSTHGMETARFWIPYVLVAGYYGFPGMEAIKNIILGLTGKDVELETKNHLIKWAGDDPQKKAIAKTIFYGAFANKELGGIDISHRVGGGDFIPSKVSDLFGPFFSSSVRAAQMAASGHWVEALREVSSAPGNIAIALRNDGEITSPWDRDRLTTKLDTKGRILKGLGFATTQESVERDVSRVIRYKERQQKDNEKKAIDSFIKAFDAKDKAGMDKAISEFAKLGMGEGTANRIKEEMLKKETERSQRAFGNLSRKGKTREIDLMDFQRP